MLFVPASRIPSKVKPISFSLNQRRIIGNRRPALLALQESTSDDKYIDRFGKCICLPQDDFLRTVRNAGHSFLLSWTKGKGEKGAVMMLVDVDELRAYLVDYCGAAMFSGFPGAIVDLSDIESASGTELCRIAERLGVDPERFVIEK